MSNIALGVVFWHERSAFYDEKRDVIFSLLGVRKRQEDSKAR
jgi:hypothetical protein